MTWQIIKAEGVKNIIMNINLGPAKRLEILKRRQKRCVCKFCGEQLDIKRMVFNEFDDARVELYCPHCDRLDYGVEEIIYRNAQLYVTEYQFDAYPDMDSNIAHEEMTIAKVADIMTWVLQGLGFLKDDGFKEDPTCDLSFFSGIVDIFYDQIDNIAEEHEKMDQIQVMEEEIK